jgi:hypothetical protein
MAVLPRSVRSALSLLAKLAVVLLVLAHGALLWQRIASQTLHEPLTLLRWAASLALIAWLLRRRARGTWNPQAMAVFWLIAVLLHVQTAGLATAEPQALLAGSSSLIWFFPVSVPLAAACALLLALVALALIIVASVQPAAELRATAPHQRIASFLALAPRPPPVALTA